MLNHDFVLHEDVFGDTDRDGDDNDWVEDYLQDTEAPLVEDSEIIEYDVGTKREEE